MMILLVPINPTLPKQTATIRLGSLAFRYRMRWISRVPGPGAGGGFYLDFYDLEGSPIVEGVRAVPWYPLADVPNATDLLPFVNSIGIGADAETVGRGALFLVDREGGGLTDAYPEIDAFEGRFSLVWMDEEAVLEMRAATS